MQYILYSCLISGQAYPFSIIEMRTRCFARLTYWSVELCVAIVEPRAVECRKLARKLPSWDLSVENYRSSYSRGTRDWKFYYSLLVQKSRPRRTISALRHYRRKENRSARETSRERRTNCIYFHHNSFRRNGFTNGANINSEFFRTLVKVRFLYARK